MVNLKDQKIEEAALEDVTGGQDSQLSTRKSDCPSCEKETIFILYTGGRAICKECGYQKFL